MPDAAVKGKETCKNCKGKNERFFGLNRLRKNYLCLVNRKLFEFRIEFLKKTKICGRFTKDTKFTIEMTIILAAFATFSVFIKLLISGFMRIPDIDPRCPIPTLKPA
jgi:hypothetical protein